MPSVHKLHETPSERLERMKRYSPLRKPKIGGPWYLVAVGLLILIAAVIAVALLATIPAMEILRAHGREILRFATQW